MYSLQAFSFSAMYSDKSLDIVCANREEFDVWTTALQVSTYCCAEFHLFLRLWSMATQTQMPYNRLVLECLGQLSVL